MPRHAISDRPSAPCTALRAVVAAPFLVSGIDALRRPHEHLRRLEVIEPLLVRAGLPPMMRSDATALTRLSGLAAVGAATAWGLGAAPRLSGAALLAMNVPITVVNNPWWTARDRAERRRHRAGLLRGAALAVGLLAATDRRPTA